MIEFMIKHKEICRNGDYILIEWDGEEPIYRGITNKDYDYIYAWCYKGKVGIISENDNRMWYCKVKSYYNWNRIGIRRFRKNCRDINKRH